MIPVWVVTLPADKPGRPDKVAAVMGDDKRLAWLVVGTSSTPWVYGLQREIAPELLAALQSHVDTFTDAGWHPMCWFLVDCPACQAPPFHPCRHLRTAEPIRSVHRPRRL